MAKKYTQIGLTKLRGKAGAKLYRKALEGKLGLKCS